MLTPNKHSHPDQTVLAVAASLLKVLKTEKVASFDRLRSKVHEIRGADYLFVPAVSFLFLLGLLDYRANSDIFEYVGPK
jgi:hypothetical protein